MKLKRLLEADDKELKQVQEIVKALPNIFKEAITTSDYFKKRLPQLAKQMDAEQAVQVLDLYVNQDYDIIKVAEKELLTAYFKDPKTLYTAAKTDFTDTLVSSALSDGYVVGGDEVHIGDKFLNGIIQLLHGDAGDLDAKQLDLLISILLQSYQSGNIKSDKLLELNNYIDRIFNGDDEAYRLKCWIFLSNSKNLSKYGLPDDFGFDFITESGQAFGDMKSKEMQFYLSQQEESEPITLIQWIYADSGEKSDYNVKFDNNTVNKDKIKVVGNYIIKNDLVRKDKSLFTRILNKLVNKSTDYSKDDDAVGLYRNLWIKLCSLKVYPHYDADDIRQEIQDFLQGREKVITKYLPGSSKQAKKSNNQHQTTNTP